MPLAVGARLGPYPVAAQIGEGGMEVYKATDTRLDPSGMLPRIAVQCASPPTHRVG